MTPKIRHRPKPSHLVGAPAETAAGSSIDVYPDGEADTVSGYEVGKNRPPLNRRFGQPGGNRPGRKPKVKGFARVRKELATPLTFFDNGKAVRLTKEEAMIREIVNKAIKGDQRKIDLLARYNLLDLREPVEASAAGFELDLEDDGFAALQALLGRSSAPPPPDAE